MQKPNSVILLAALMLVLVLIACDAAQPSIDTPSVGNSPAEQAATVSNQNPDIAAKIPAELSKDAARVGQVTFFVLLTEQADTSVIPEGVDRGKYVVDKLLEVANRTQPVVKAELDRLKAESHVTRYESFWGVNGFSVTGDSYTIGVLTAHSDVLKLTYND